MGNLQLMHGLMRAFFIQISTLIVLLLAIKDTHGQARIDSNYIRLFEKKNVIEIYPGIYSTRFNFTTPREIKTNYSLVANSSGFVGIYLSYKWFSIKYSWAIPGTELAKHIKLQSRSFSFNFGMKQLSFRPFYNTYNGLLIPAKSGSRDYIAFHDIKFSDAGADIYYFFSPKRFSYRAANSFSEQQVRSKGALFIKITSMWQKINWKEPSREVITDSATYDLLSYDPEWFSLITRLGYTYNFSFSKGKWNITPTVLIGGGALREINTGVNHLQLVTDIQASLRTGYNATKYYFYLSAKWGNLQTNLFIKNMHQVNGNLSITAGYRFRSLKNKILGIL